MILPTFLKRRTSRRTSKRRQSLSNSKPKYDSLERRNLLATFVVTNADDVVADDGLLSLREAVIAANTNEAFSDAVAGDVEGDRIIFAAGLPGNDPSDIQSLTQGELEITDDLVIVGRPNEFSPVTSIESGFNSRIFNVNTTERVHFRQLGLSSGKADFGGALLVQPGGDVTIVDSSFGGGQADQGGAIGVVDSRLFVRNSQFSNNASENGGAIYARGSDVRIVDSSFDSNRTFGSGGAIHASGGRLGLFGSDFGSIGGNAADDSGGAIYVVGSSSEEGVLVSSSSFSNNDSENGGAIFAGENTSAFILSESQFLANGSGEGEGLGTNGGAIFSEGNGLYVSDALFSGNDGVAGGAIYSAADYSNFSNANINGNTASTAGGGVVFAGIEAYLNDSNISDNVSGGTGGGLETAFGSSNVKVVLRRTNVSDNRAASSGGGIVSRAGSTLRVFASSITDNDAVRGGAGILAFDSDLLITASSITDNLLTGEFTGSGGGIRATAGTLLMFDSTISDNKVDGNAGGLLIQDGFARLQNTNFYSNRSKAAGGAIDARSSTLVLIGGEVSSNAATEFVFGSRAGAVNVDSGSRMFVRGGTRFESNSAQAFGGAIQVTGLLSVRDATFASNSASSGGAIFLAADGRAYFERTEFSSNRAEDNGAAIFARAEFSTNPILILTDSTISGNEVTDNENGTPVFVNGSVFWRVTGGSNFNNTPLDGVGVFNR